MLRTDVTRRGSRDLATARRCLAAAEAAFLSDDALYQLDEGLSLLGAIAADGDPRERAVARNVAAACVRTLAQRIAAALASRDVPEPELKHLMRASQLLAASEFAETAGTDLAALTVTAANRYLDALFEGHSPEEKAREIERIKRRLLEAEDRSSES